MVSLSCNSYDAEAVKQEAILKAEAKAAEILKEAEAKANASNLKL